MIIYIHTYIHIYAMYLRGNKGFDTRGFRGRKEREEMMKLYFNKVF